MWIDFEDTWRGPVAWDVCHGLRAMFGLCWRFLMVLHFHEREDAARDALRTWFNQTA